MTPRAPRHTVRLLTALLLAAVPSAAYAQNGNGTPLTELRFDIVGIRLVVDPPTLTVPKNIPTQINTSLAVPDGAGTDVLDALAALSAGAVIEAELRGPSIPATRIAVPPGSPIPIPAFALPGDYFLDRIRLVRNGETLLDATTPDGQSATTIPIRVISEVFVTTVTSRPLTLDEIRERGIVIDQSNYQAMSFQAAFNIDGQPFTIEMPALLPTVELLRTVSDRRELIRQVALVNQTLAATQTRLPPELDRPGINFSISALPFFIVPDDSSDIPELEVPPITGLVVIAGNVAFLNQFFKVSVLVANVTPEGSRLLLRDVTGTVVLPAGADRIPGTPDNPGDDPLRLARLDGGIVQPTTPIVQAGPDGVVGTADDIAVLEPQAKGEGEILLEGRAEGGHSFEVNIEAYLDGLPSGPVRLMGLAAGAVFVRNPTFSVTLAHPRTIRSGETYDVYATVTNTSLSIANLVSVNLDPLSISGAQLLSDATVGFENIPAGESATARFTLLAQRTGEVTFTSFTGDAAQGGGIRLFTGVGERNVPLAPNSIVLPRTTNALPQSLVAAAQRVLGQAFSIATAPAEALPPDVLYVRRQTVVDRALELAQAGERVQLGEPLTRALRDLLLDWTGNTTFDAGFDQLLRMTDAGAALLAELAAVAAADVGASTAFDYQQALAVAGAARPAPHVSAIVDGPPGVPTPILTLTRADGTTVQPGAAGVTTAPGGAHLALEVPSRPAALGLIAIAEPVRHVFEIAAAAAGTFDFGIVVPGPQAGSQRQLRFPGVALGAGGVARIEMDLASPTDPPLMIDANGDGASDGSVVAQAVEIQDGPPQILAVRQMVSSFREAAGDPFDPATYGLIAAVLFDKPVTVETAETRANYAVEANAVLGARLQQSRRLVYLYLQQPIGGLVPRSLSVSGIADGHGATITPQERSIEMALTDGARVFGQVREAGGQPVAGAVLQLSVALETRQSFMVSSIRTDQNGAFDFDFVPRIGLHFTLRAQHPQTTDLTSVSARIRVAGEQLLLNPTFTGRGTVRGRLLAPDGVTPVPATQVALIPGTVFSLRGFPVRTNALGEFQFTDVPVGVFTLTASDGQRGFAQAPGIMNSAGDVVVQDLVLVTQPEDTGQVVGRVFLGDGVTPGAGFLVYAGEYHRDRASIEAVDQAATDDSGSFAFARGFPPGPYDIVAVDPATQQIGIVRVRVSAGLTYSVSIVLEATGAVEGVVFNAQGQPVPGAVIAGGLALGTADTNGFFRIEGVPAGTRTIDAGDPITRRRGSVQVTVVPGQTVQAAITLEARATITGRVLDAAGTPMPNISVRLPVQGGFTFVFTNNQGVYTFPNLGLGSHLIQAPGPSVESLIEYMISNGINPRSAYTTGDAPEGLGPAPPPAAGDSNAILAAYQEAVQRYVTVDDSLFGLPMDDRGGFGWNRVQLFQDSTTVAADVRFLSQGSVSGRTEDAAARPIGALVRVLGLGVSRTGFARTTELGRITTDAATGEFAFSGVPRFDLETFQAAGVRGGDFTLDAAQPFSPAILSYRGQLNTSTPDRHEVVLRFPAAGETNGTISGQVLMPDGVSSAPPSTQVAISFGDLTVLTGADGRFASLLPIPAGTYTVTATAPNGLRGRAVAVVPAGGNADIQVRLLGLGNATVVVRRPDGVPVVNALVHFQRATFPNDQADGRTDASGTVSFVNLTEGPASVVAEEETTGLTGRASGTIVRDSTLTIPVTITASGRVTGRFLSADGSQVIPSASITLTVGSVQAFTATGPDGRFELLSVPVGRFTIAASDPLTGRTGRASGELLFEGHAVDVVVLQLPRGTVAGVVLNADETTPVPAARVRLRSSGTIRTDLQATANADGRFRFDGVPEGAFELEATDPLSGFGGTATGRIRFEQEFLDLNVTLRPFGSLRVVVQDVAGQPAGNATLTLTGAASRSAAVLADGSFTFEHMPLGVYRIVARSLANAGDAGVGEATIAQPNEAVDATVQFRGTGSVEVTVVAADGVTPVASAQVTLSARGAFGDELPGPAAGLLNGFTNASGVGTFVNVPVGDFSVRGESQALAGVTNGSIASDGQSTAVTIQLGASGSVSGRVLLPDGVTPAAQAIVTLRFQSQSQLQSGVLQVTTPIDGTFQFSGIPLGTFTLSAYEIVSTGVATVQGTISANGELVALGDVVLDNAGPTIVSIDPPHGSSNVAADAVLTLTFNEPIQPATLSHGGATANVVLSLAGAPVALEAPVFTDGNRIVSYRPEQPLVSSAAYTFSVRGGPDGPQDAAGLPLLEPFVSTFTARDTTPPVVVSTSPAAAAQGILPEASIRVAFSEPVASGSLVVTDSGGAPVPGTVAFAAANTALVFTPQGFLAPNTSYAVTIGGVADFSGNPLPGAPLTFQFFTVDTLAPIITALQLAGTPRAGAPVSVQPVITGDDTARVEFQASSGASGFAVAAPFGFAFTLPANAPSATVSAVAIDNVGNRSAPFDLAIPIQANEPPAVTLVNPLGTTDVSQGLTLALQVQATDDGELAQILLSVVGAVTFSSSHVVTSGQSASTATFNVPIPAGALSGQAFTVQAAAVDTAGLQSAPATLVFTLRDGVRPTATILAPVNNAVVVPGQSVDLVVDASDDVALATVTVSCVPAGGGCESRAVAPATTTRQTFTIVVPDTLQAPQTLALTVTVTDAAGNTTAAGRVLEIADVVAPAIATLESVSGSTQVVAGETVTIRASVTDSVGVTALTFVTEGALVTSGTVTVAPPVTSGSATFPIQVPADAPNGASVTVRVSARDAAGNPSDEAAVVLTVGDEAPPTATIVAPAGGTSFSPGQSITLDVQASDDVGVARLNVSVSGSFETTDTRIFAPAITPVTATFSIPVPADAAAGEVVITVEAIDASGASSGPVQRTVAVRDVVAPVVQILSPAPGALVDPRQAVTVVVEGTDAVGVTQMGYGATGVAAASETRAIDPASTGRTETFSFTIAPLPAAGGSLTLTASARDGAGNDAAATAVVVQVQDVVAPQVLSTTPADGATGVAVDATLTVRFTEPMDPATLTATAVQLRRGTDVVPVAQSLNAGADVLSLIPVEPLAMNTEYAIVVAGTAADPSGNNLGTERTFTFRTASPDTEAPRVLSTSPADGATAVSLVTPVTVNFTEPIEPASITSESFRVTVAGAPVAGSLFIASAAVAQFIPAEPFPTDTLVTVTLTDGITDEFNNPLAAADGSPLTEPLVFTFTTGSFSLVRPVGSEVIERTTIQLEARATAALGVSTVVFTVNGQDLPAVSAPFVTTYAVPSAAEVSSLTIVASGRNSSGTEIARDERTVNVVVALTVAPRLVGVPVGGESLLRFEVSSPLAEDLPVTLSAGNESLVSFPVNPVVLPAGATSVEARVAGLDTGATAVIGTSARGTAAATVSVSPLTPGQVITTDAPRAGASIATPPLAAIVTASGGTTRTIVVPLLIAPAGEPTTVSVFSSNTAVATATATTIGAGEQSTTVEITTHGDGVGEIVVSVGGQVRSIRIFVGVPPQGLVPLTMAPIVGTSLLNPPLAGYVVTAAGRADGLVVSVLSAPAGAETAVTVTSTNPDVATATTTSVAPGSQIATITITAVGDGAATLVIRAGNEVRGIRVFVGPPPPGTEPLLLAPIAGASVLSATSMGRVIAPAGTVTSATLGIPLLGSPAGGAVQVTVTSSRPDIALVNGVGSALLTLDAGGQVLHLSLGVTGVEGAALLTFEFNGERRELLVVVGEPPANQIPAITAPIAGVRIGG